MLEKRSKNHRSGNVLFKNKLRLPESAQVGQMRLLRAKQRRVRTPCHTHRVCLATLRFRM